MSKPLGHRIALYSNKNRPISNYLKDIYGLIAFIFGVTGLIAVFSFMSEGQTESLVVLMICIAVLLIPAYVVITNRNNYVELYESGFVFSKQNVATTIYYDEIKSTRWSSLERFKGGFITTEYYTLVIEKNDGVILKLTNPKIYTILDFGFRIQQAVSVYQLPELIKRLQNGEELEIASLRITSQGLQRKKKFLYWNEVNYSYVERSFIKIMKKSNPVKDWEWIALSKHNSMLLHDFINTYLKIYHNNYQIQS